MSAEKSPPNEGYGRVKQVAYIGVGAAAVTGVCVVGSPLVLGAIGYGAGGIAGGSTAAGMMSSAALANGGGVVTGSLVSLCQSAGAVGIGVKTLSLMSGGGAAFGGMGGYYLYNKMNPQTPESVANDGQKMLAGAGEQQSSDNSQKSVPYLGYLNSAYNYTTGAFKSGWDRSAPVVSSWGKKIYSREKDPKSKL